MVGFQDTIKKLLLPLVVKFQGSLPQRIKNDITKLMEALKKKKNGDAEYASLYEGEQFPQENEIDPVFIMCQYIIENYKCIDALDQTKKQF